MAHHNYGLTWPERFGNFLLDVSFHIWHLQLGGMYPQFA
jgi:hypothetical protein